LLPFYKGFIYFQFYGKEKESYAEGFANEPDLIDLEALVDSELSYSENKKRIMEIVGLKGRGYGGGRKSYTKKEAELEEIYDIIRQAQMYHEMRSERARRLDESKPAKIPRRLEAWFRHPEKYDLPTVDHPTASIEDLLKKKNKKRKKTKKNQKGKKSKKTEKKQKKSKQKKSKKAKKSKA